MAKKNQITISDYLEYSEYERLLQKLREDKEYLWELFARLTFCTACRVSDVLNKKWEDILDKDQITVVEKKTGKPRIITFNSSVRKKLKELYSLLGKPKPDSLIFCSSRSQGAFTVQHVNRKWKYFRDRYRLGIKNFSTHTFRKTFGRYVYEINNRSAESLVLLNKILNHTSISVTKTYIGLVQDEINNVFNSIKF